MKTLLISLLCTSLLLLVNTSFAQTTKAGNLKKQTVKVWGKCGMCKEKIEAAAIGAGAQSARWNTSTKILSLAYEPATTDLNKIENAVAAVGYDTKDVAASTEAYTALPACCQYQRAASINKTVASTCCTDKACCKTGSCSKDGTQCTDMKACKDKACCNGAETAAACCKDNACCKDGSCGNGAIACADSKACQRSGCCNKTVSTAASCCKEKSCCKGENCSKDAAKCADMAACKNSQCCKS